MRANERKFPACSHSHHSSTFYVKCLMTTDPKPMTKFIAIFAVSYIGLLVGASYAVYYLAPQSHPTTLNIIAIVLSVILVNFLFARQYKRRFMATEYWTIVISCVIIDAAIQFLACLPFIFGDTPPKQPLLPGFFL